MEMELGAHIYVPPRVKVIAVVITFHRAPSSGSIFNLANIWVFDQNICKANANPISLSFDLC